MTLLQQAVREFVRENYPNWSVAIYSHEIRLYQDGHHDLYLEFVPDNRICINRVVQSFSMMLRHPIKTWGRTDVTPYTLIPMLNSILKDDQIMKREQP